MDYILISVFLLQVFLIIVALIKKPYFKIGRFSFESYAVLALLGPIVLFILGYFSLGQLSTLSSGVANPVNILVLFLSMVFISIYLDEVGFIEFCARWALKWAGRSALKLFIYLYAIVSVLTIFTSNDIIILTFTPFIYYFAKSARIDPKPFLFAEFFAANTWSLILQIGNPTNIYISTSYGITFIEYLKVMWFIGLVAGIVNLLVIYLIFRKSLSQQIKPSKENPFSAIKDGPGAIIGLLALIVCTVFLSISDYLRFSMWEISLYCAFILALAIIVRSSFERKNHVLSGLMFKMPWSIVPFVLGFFIMVRQLYVSGIASEIGVWLASFGTSNTALIYSYGISSAVASNILNNIPMSVLFTQIMSGLSGEALRAAAYASIIGSNIGAYFTPIGALAGIMWMSILKRKGVKISYLEFIKYGLIVGTITLVAALATLSYVIK
jgi:arsenical pump membrane protein